MFDALAALIQNFRFRCEPCRHPIQNGLICVSYDLSKGGICTPRSQGTCLTALTVALFILNLRRAGERAGRAAGRLETLERDNVVQRQMLDAASRRPRSRDDLLERLRGGGF